MVQLSYLIPGPVLTVPIRADVWAVASLCCWVVTAGGELAVVVVVAVGVLTEAGTGTVVKAARSWRM